MSPPACKVVPEELDPMEKVNGKNTTNGKRNNIYRRESADVNMNRRGSNGQSPSRGLLNGLRSLVGRQRSDSVSAVSALKKKKENRPLVKFQVNGCKIDNVFDLREGEEGDFYDDDRAFRRPRSNSSDFLILRKTSRPLSVDVVGLVDGQSDPYRQYLKVVNCYELAPQTSLVVHIDKELPIRKAFEALCFNKVAAALVWDSTKQQIISIVTLSDFLRILQRLNVEGTLRKLSRAVLNPQSMDKEDVALPLPENVETEPLVVKLNKVIIEEGNYEAEFQPIEDVQGTGTEPRVITVGDIVPHQKLVRVPHNYMLFDACKTFCNVHVHRLVVMGGEGGVLYLLTLKRILQAIHKQNRSLHFAQWLNEPINKSNVGTWTSPIITANVKETVNEAVTKMLESRISGLPLVNDDGRVVNVLVKNDVALGFYHVPIEDHHKLLQQPIGDMVLHRSPSELLRPTDPVGKVLDTLLGSPHVRSVFIIDQEGRAMACISMSDIIRHITQDDVPFQRATPQKPDNRVLKKKK